MFTLVFHLDSCFSCYLYFLLYSPLSLAFCCVVGLCEEWVLLSPGVYQSLHLQLLAFSAETSTTNAFLASFQTSFKTRLNWLRMGMVSNSKTTFVLWSIMGKPALLTPQCVCLFVCLFVCFVSHPVMKWYQRGFVKYIRFGFSWTAAIFQRHRMHEPKSKSNYVSATYLVFCIVKQLGLLTSNLKPMQQLIATYFRPNHLISFKINHTKIQ